jgi:hypothetical protein
MPNLKVCGPPWGHEPPVDSIAEQHRKRQDKQREVSEGESNEMSMHRGIAVDQEVYSTWSPSE